MHDSHLITSFKETIFKPLDSPLTVDLITRLLLSLLPWRLIVSAIACWVDSKLGCIIDTALNMESPFLECMSGVALIVRGIVAFLFLRSYPSFSIWSN